MTKDELREALKQLLLAAERLPIEDIIAVLEEQTAALRGDGFLPRGEGEGES